MEVRPDPAGLERLVVTAPEWDASFEVFGVCPVQALGTVCGRDLYFRARHGGWSFDVADRGGHLPSDGYQGTGGFFREGIDPHHGYMPLPEAVAGIAECLREYIPLAPCLVGSTSRQTRFLPRWRTETVLALSTGIEQEEAYDRLPILADALEEAGCNDADILTHCRRDGSHTRGCWVVDLVLGNE